MSDDKFVNVNIVCLAVRFLFVCLLLNLCMKCTCLRLTEKGHSKTTPPLLLLRIMPAWPVTNVPEKQVSTTL